MARYNPFRPGNIITPGMFSGRVDELFSLEKALFQTKNGNPKHFLICGERGIGKSSLLLYIHYVAEGTIALLEGDRFSFVTVSVALEPAISYATLIKKIGAEFQRSLASQQRYKDLLKNIWDFLSRWEVMGVKYQKEEANQEPHELLDDLVHTMDAALRALGGQVDGVLILIDEADKAPAEARLGEFCKLFTERLSKRGCNNVALGLAGLTEVIEKLRTSHESSPRIFEILHLKPLAPDETIDVVRKGLKEIKEKTDIEVTATPEAEELISSLSEGYPYFIQQFAQCACDTDQDNKITLEDVQAGAHGEHGALQQLGLKVFHELYFERIFSDEYRGVLQFMAQHGTEWVSKEVIRKALSLKDATLNNAINALKKKKIILAKEGHKGTYRLPTNSFATWIRAYTQKAEALPLPFPSD